MKILVLLKYSYDVSEINVDPVTAELKLAGVPEKIGNIDRNVVEAAVQVKEATGGFVQSLTLGPLQARDSFKEVLAMGVDEAFLMEDPYQGNGRPAAAVRLMEAAIQKIGPYDLVLCGFASDDGYSHQVGPRLAERLKMPFISYTRSLEVQDGRISAIRDLEKTLQQVEAPLPCLISIAEEAFPPRRTTLMDAIRAKKKPIHLLTMQEYPELLKIYDTNSSECVHTRKTGVLVQRKRQIIQWEDPAQTADALLDLLLREKILKEGQ